MSTPETTTSRMARLGFVLVPDTDTTTATSLYLAKLDKLPGGEYGPASYGNLSVRPDGWWQADPHHPEEDGYGHPGAFETFTSALDYLLNDHERVTGPLNSPILSYDGGYPAALLAYLLIHTDVPALDDATVTPISMTEVRIIDSSGRSIRITIADEGSAS